MAHNLRFFNSYATMTIAFNSSILYLNIILVVGLNSTIDLLFYTGFFIFSPSLTNELSIIIKNNTEKIDSETQLNQRFNNLLGSYKIYSHKTSLMIFDDDQLNDSKAKLDGSIPVGSNNEWNTNTNLIPNSSIQNDPVILRYITYLTKTQRK